MNNLVNDKRSSVRQVRFKQTAANKYFDLRLFVFKIQYFNI